MLSFALTSMTAHAQRKSPQPKTSARGSSNSSASATKANAAATNAVLLPNRSPLVTFRLLFMTGAANDPAGKEGLATLTASLVSGGGTRTLPYEKIQEAFYPMAASFGSQVDKEMTVFTGTTHADNLPRYYGLISGMLLDPGFREDDFTRIKTNTINYLKVSLREGNDEELGKEQLYNNIYAGHPYGHHNAGGISALERLTLADVREFYRTHYTQANMVLGLAGGYPANFPAKVKADFARLPEGTRTPSNFFTPKLELGTHIDIDRSGRESHSAEVYGHESVLIHHRFQRRSLGRLVEFCLRSSPRFEARQSRDPGACPPRGLAEPAGHLVAPLRRLACEHETSTWLQNAQRLP